MSLQPFRLALVFLGGAIEQICVSFSSVQRSMSHLKRHQNKNNKNSSFNWVSGPAIDLLSVIEQILSMELSP